MTAPLGESIQVQELVKHLGSLVAPARFGILICGSATRPSAVAPGDIDVVIVIDQPWIQKSKERWQGVLLDIQIGPAKYYADRLTEEQPAGLVRMFATGSTFSDQSGFVGFLQATAKRIFAAGPVEIPFQVLYERQRIAALLGRARRYLPLYPVIARSLAYEALAMTVHLAAYKDGCWPDSFTSEYSSCARDKRFEDILAGLLQATDAKAIEILETLLERVTGESFELSLCATTPRIRIGK